MTSPHLLTLPAELRNQIYNHHAHALQNTPFHTVKLTANGLIVDPALADTCKQLRSEFLPIFQHHIITSAAPTLVQAEITNYNFAPLTTYFTTFPQPPDGKLKLEIRLTFTGPKLTSSEGLWTWLKYRETQHRQSEEKFRQDQSHDAAFALQLEYQVEVDWSVYTPEDMHELADWAGFLSDVLKLPWNLDGGSIWNEITAELVDDGFYDRGVENIRTRH